MSSSQVLANWNGIMANVTDRGDGFITLQHDLWLQSVDLATGYILPDALAHDPPFRIQPIVSCLNRPLSAAYIETNDNKTNPPPAQGGFLLVIWLVYSDHLQAAAATAALKLLVEAKVLAIQPSVDGLGSISP